MNNHLIPVENHEGYAKDTRSSAYVFTDKSALEEYKQKKKTAKYINELKHEINMLKAEITTIKKHLNLG